MGLVVFSGKRAGEGKEQILSIDPYTATPGTTEILSRTSAHDNTSNI